MRSERDPHDRRDCEWCNKPINPLNFLTLETGGLDLEFCSNECMEDWQERENDRRIERAYERSCQ